MYIRLRFSSNDRDRFRTQVTIIDYTLSRIRIGGRVTLFNDLSKDPDLFVAEGDFQFDVYRMMRNAVK